MKMANKKYDDADGVWRTIGGRRVFIRTGQSLSDAMKESGKFNTKKKEEPKDTNKNVQQKMDETNDKIAKHLENVSKVAQEMGDEKLADMNKNASNYAKSLIKGDAPISERDAKDLLKQLNDEGSDFTFNEDVVIKDGKLITDVGVMMPEEDGFTSRELQIPLDDVKDYADLEAKLRDWEDRHRSVEDWENIDFEPKELDSKSVLDSDGFTTDYTLYEMPDGKYKAVFGDKDVYGPDADADMEFDNLKEAQEWFDDYKGFEDEEPQVERKNNPYARNNEGGSDDNSSEFAQEAIDHWNKKNEEYKAQYGKDDELAKSFAERWEKEKASRLKGEEKANKYAAAEHIGFEDETNDDEIVNDDEKSLNYSFRVGDRNIFEVRYDRTGNNKNMDFATSSSELNSRRTDITRGGQAQKDLLKEGTKAREFYDKWDNKHLGTLTQKEYNELVNDIEDLKKEYPHIEGHSFYAQAQLDRETKALKKSSGKRFPTNISKDVYEMDADKGNAWSGNAVQKTANGEQFISVRRNGPSQNSAEDIANNLTKKYPQLNAKVVGDNEVKLTLKSTNDAMNNMIKEKASKKSTFKDDLPKHTEIKTQGTSNRKEVSENIQAHILEHYDSPQDFIEQMDAYDWKPTLWHRGEALAEDGFYDIYYEDQRKFLDDLKINPKGKEFSDDKVFQTYKSLIGRESAKLYERLQKNEYNKYKKSHPLTQMTFEEFKNRGK